MSFSPWIQCESFYFGSIIAKHKALEGLSQASVEYQALQLVSLLEHYGVEWHWVRDAEGQRLAIGVGPEGIAICREDFTLVNRLECGAATKPIVLLMV